MNIHTHTIGYGQPTFVIAELCSNIIRWITIWDDVARQLPNKHKSQRYSLEKMIERVSGTGADALKVQLYRADHFPPADQIQKRQTEFPRELFPDFVELAHRNGLAAGASVFDVDAVRLCEDTGADFLKLATREFGNEELRVACSNSSLPMFQSFDATKYDHRYSTSNCIYLACVPQYPTIAPRIPPNMDLKDDWGWSSHSPNNGHSLDCLVAVSRGACVIERHIAFSVDDPELGWSLLPDNFRVMIDSIRCVERMR